MRESVGRSTVTVPSSTTTRIDGDSVRVSVPLSPDTLTWLPSSVTVTPGGTVTGILPMRDIRSPHVGDDFAAEPGALRGASGHEAVRRRDDRDAETAEHARDLRLARVHTQTRLADAAQAAQGATLGVRQLERHREDLFGCLSRHLVRLDETLFGED